MSRSVQNTGYFGTLFFIELPQHAMVVYKDDDGFNETAPCTININIRAKNSRRPSLSKAASARSTGITKVTFTVKARILVPQPRLYRQHR